MKVLAILLVSLIVVYAEEYGYRSAYHAPGFQHVGNGIASAYRNDARQHAVNSVAEHYGSGTGTARFVGVPGTNGNYGYARHGGYGGHNAGYNGAYNHGAYNHGAYSHGGYGYSGY